MIGRRIRAWIPRPADRNYADSRPAPSEYGGPEFAVDHADYQVTILVREGQSKQGPILVIPNPLRLNKVQPVLFAVQVALTGIKFKLHALE